MQLTLHLLFSNNEFSIANTPLCPDNDISIASTYQENKVSVTSTLFLSDNEVSITSCFQLVKFQL